MALPEAYDREQVDTHLTQRLEGVKIEIGTILNDAAAQMELIKEEVAKVVSEGERIREQVVIDSARGDQLRNDINVTYEKVTASQQHIEEAKMYIDGLQGQTDHRLRDAETKHTGLLEKLELSFQSMSQKVAESEEKMKTTEKNLLDWTVTFRTQMQQEFLLQQRQQLKLQQNQHSISQYQNLQNSAQTI